MDQFKQALELRFAGSLCKYDVDNVKKCILKTIHETHPSETNAVIGFLDSRFNLLKRGVPVIGRKSDPGQFYIDSITKRAQKPRSLIKSLYIFTHERLDGKMYISTINTDHLTAGIAYQNGVIPEVDEFDPGLPVYFCLVSDLVNSVTH